MHSSWQLSNKEQIQNQNYLTGVTSITLVPARISSFHAQAVHTFYQYARTAKLLFASAARA